MKKLMINNQKLSKFFLWKYFNLNKTVIGLFILILFWDTAAQIFLKIGVSAHGQFPTNSSSAMVDYFKAIVTEPMVWLGVVTLIFAFITWLAILSRVELSKAHPATSFSYITVTLSSVVFLHEQITSFAIAGIFLIIIGVCLIVE